MKKAKRLVETVRVYFMKKNTKTPAHLEILANITGY